MIKKWFVRSIMLLTATLTIALTILLTTVDFSKPEKKELNLFVWGAFLSPETIASFEKKYDAKVHLHLATNNEEMLSKLKRSKPGSFDLVFASDYAVKKIRESNLASEIDRSRVDFYSRIMPQLLNRDYDPENKYSIPYAWEVYGIAENTALYTPPEVASLDELFVKTSSGHRIVMTPDPVEAFSIASYYLYKKTSNLTPDEAANTKRLLRKQKSWVEAYADYRAKYLVATENCPVALVKSSFLADLKKESPEIQYRLPKEVTFVSIENLVIPRSAKNPDVAYDFINHITQKEEYKRSYQFCAVFPACLDAVEGSILDIKEIHEVIDEVQKRKNLESFDFVIPAKDLMQAWVRVKS